MIFIRTELKMFVFLLLTFVPNKTFPECILTLCPPPPQGRVGCTRWQVCGCTRCWSASLLWLESPSSVRWPWCSLFSTHSEKSSTATSGTSHTQVHRTHNTHTVSIHVRYVYRCEFSPIFVHVFRAEPLEITWAAQPIVQQRHENRTKRRHFRNGGTL